MPHLFAIAATAIGAVCVLLLWGYARGLAASTVRQAAAPQRLDGEAVEEEGSGETGELVLNTVQSIHAREGRDEMSCIEPAQATNTEATHLLVL